MTEPVITIQDAKCLMEILSDDIPSWDQSRVALTLLILAANPSLAENGKDIIAKSKWEGRTSTVVARCYGSEETEDDYYAEYYGY